MGANLASRYNVDKDTTKTTTTNDDNINSLKAYSIEEMMKNVEKKRKRKWHYKAMSLSSKLIWFDNKFSSMNTNNRKHKKYSHDNDDINWERYKILDWVDPTLFVGNASTWVTFFVYLLSFISIYYYLLFDFFDSPEGFFFLFLFFF